MFFEVAGMWISFGLLEDVTREFFIWDTKGIKSTDIERLEVQGNIEFAFSKLHCYHGIQRSCWRKSLCLGS